MFFRLLTVVCLFLMTGALLHTAYKDQKVIDDPIIEVSTTNRILNSFEKNSRDEASEFLWDWQHWPPHCSRDHRRTSKDVFGSQY